MSNKEDESKIKKKKLTILIVYGLVVLALTVAGFFLYKSQFKKEVNYSEFKTYVKEGKVEKVAINLSSNQVSFQMKSQGKWIEEYIVYYATATEDYTTITAFLEENHIATFTGELQSSSTILLIIVNVVLPILMLVFLWRVVFKRMGSGFDSLNFGKDKGKIYAENETGITFADVAGEDEAKESLEEIVDLLHNPEKYTEIGAKMPKGALLVGPPGTGKTMLAKAVAGEAKVPFFSMSGSEFVQMFVGMGAARVRDLFKQAQEKAPCIIFIDEIDAIGKTREGTVYSNDEREQTLNQLLTEMDGFDSSKGVVIIGATNRPEVLDPALLRPGRFDRRVTIDIPDLVGREAILQVHSKQVRMSSDVDLMAIAKTTPGASGADLANIINEAALLAVRRGRKVVEQCDLEEALEVVIAGKVKKDRVLNSKEKQAVAYHEIGHAFLAHELKHADDVHKITIIPRTNGALGYTMQTPEDEHYLVTKEEMEDQIAVCLAGRSAEEVLLHQVSTGASNDIEKATEMARRMVTIYGMTERFDMVALETSKSLYLDGSSRKNFSSVTEKELDDEVLSIIKTQHNRAKAIIEANQNKVKRAADYLVEKETITGEEFNKILLDKTVSED